MRKILVIIFLGLLLSSCQESWEVAAPEEIPSGSPNTAIRDSLILIPIQIPTSLITSKVMEATKYKPIFSGRTDEISAKLLVNEHFSDVFEDVLVTPGKLAGCLLVTPPGTCTEQKPTNETYRCIAKVLLGVPIFKKCARTVMRSVPVPCAKVNQCWDKIEPVFESQLKLAAHIKSKLAPTSVWINYEGWLQDINIGAVGKNIYFKAKVQIDVSADVKQGLLGASVKVNGILKCNSKFGISAIANTTINPDASVGVEITKFTINASRLCIPGAVKIAPIALLDLKNFISVNMIKEFLNEPILNAINKQISGDNNNAFDFKKNLDQLSRDLERPFTLGNDSWLQVNPKAVLVTQLNGIDPGPNNKITLSAGIKAQPIFSVGSKPALSENANPIKFLLVDQIPTGFFLAVKGKIELKYAESLLTNELQKSLKAFNPDSRYQIGEVRLYQSKKRFVIRLLIMKEEYEVGQLYLMAEPVLNMETQKLQLKNVKFTADSQNILLKSANWIFSSKIEKIVEKKASFDYSSEINKIIMSLSVIRLENDIGTITGSVDKITPRDIWMENEAINILVEAKGKLLVELNSKN